MRRKRRTRSITRGITRSLVDPLSSGIAGVFGRGLSGLLSLYPGATAAYSLRKIGSGPVVRLRRASDNAEQDFMPEDLSGSSEGAELLTNGDFSSGSTGWTLATEWSIVGGQAVLDGTQTGTSLLRQSDVDGYKNVQGIFKFTFDITCSDYTNFQIQIPSGVPTASQLEITADGTYSVIFDTRAGTGSWGNITFYSITNGVTATIDNVSLVPYTPTAAEQWVIDNAGFTFSGSSTTRLTTDSAYATTWYDQSGSGNDAIQATAAEQPKLITAGVINTDNGKPALSFDGVDDSFSLPETALAENSFFGCVRTSPDISSSFRVIAGKFLSDYIRINTTGALSVNSGGISTDTIAGVFLDNEQVLISFVFAGGQWQTNKNGSSVGSGAETQSTLIVSKVGEANDIWFWDSNVQEIIFYPNDQTANRTGIETNINDHYGIY